jgi:hypothetical protein
MWNAGVLLAGGSCHAILNDDITILPGTRADNVLVEQPTIGSTPTSELPDQAARDDRGPAHGGQPGSAA